MSLITHDAPSIDQKNQSVQSNQIQQLVEEAKQRLKTSTNLALPLDQALTILDQFSEFELGRFLLINRGLSGYWISYIILPSRQPANLHPLEEWIINRAPTAMATRERFHIFQEEIQARLKPGMKIASIPCGLMDDLLSLDYTGLEDIEIYGIDLDKESLDLTDNNTKNYQLKNKIHLLQKDAWDLGMKNQLDLITSNGLNVYEPDDNKVTALYKNFYEALRPHGILVTSFLTPPPTIDPNSKWRPFNMEDLMLQKAVFQDILQAKWQALRSEDKTREQLEKAGFKDISFVYDQQRMYPTVVAKKG